MARTKKQAKNKKKPSQMVKRKRNKKKHGITFTSLTRKIKKHVLQQKPKGVNEAIKVAMRGTSAVKNLKKIKLPRVIKIPKTGGILPLLPIFAGLSALGALGSGASQIANAINSSKLAKRKLEEDQRHNRQMEAIAVSSGGKGLYLKPYKKGFGLFLGKRNHHHHRQRY